MEPIPRECIAAVDVIVAKDTSEVGLLSKWNQIADVLVRYNLAMVEMIHPNQMLCHPSDMGQTGTQRCRFTPPGVAHQDGWW